jgi:hypothetical protein
MPPTRLGVMGVRGKRLRARARAQCAIEGGGSDAPEGAQRASGARVEAPGRATVGRYPVSLVQASRKAQRQRVGTRADACTPGTVRGARTNASKGPLAHTERGQPAGFAQPIRRGVSPVGIGCRREPASASWRVIALWRQGEILVAARQSALLSTSVSRLR